MFLSLSVGVSLGGYGSDVSFTMFFCFNSLNWAVVVLGTTLLSQSSAQPPPSAAALGIRQSSLEALRHLVLYIQAFVDKFATVSI
mmetsp:Transcript_29026/g.43882  ORF Transcript_29026/g.43882 Transcript_29026/m.43882 type:complete len:85 (+) Transcript_29026:219-473(+)